MRYYRYEREASENTRTARFDRYEGHLRVRASGNLNNSRVESRTVTESKKKHKQFLSTWVLVHEH
jgi:hypothetical protein